ncbi:MAG TPA: HEAT repeat domain-containing protein, partial [Tepidisphaeraceae bacterium]|nr:HEAT repeat domain-containing protein [Tepidisphaeraceae bacterium]
CTVEYLGVLSAIGEPGVPTLTKLFDELPGDFDKSQAARVLFKTGDFGAARIRSAIISTIATERAAAAYAMEQSKDGRDLESLRALLDDPVPLVRQNAIKALEAHGKAALPAAPRLLKIVDADDPLTQSYALSALATIHPDAASVLPHLSKPLGKKSWAALRVVSAYGSEAQQFTPLVTECLGDDETTTLAALEALGRIGPQAAAAVGRIATYVDAKSACAEAALTALIEIGPEALPAAPRVRELLVTENLSIDKKLLAARALGAIGLSQKDAMSLLVPLATANYGSMSVAPESVLRVMASWDVDEAIRLLANEAAKPTDDFFGQRQHQAAGAVERLKKIKKLMQDVRASADAARLTTFDSDNNSTESQRWANVFRPGDAIERVLALRGPPVTAGAQKLSYKSPEQIIQIDKGTIRSIRTGL